MTDHPNPADGMRERLGRRAAEMLLKMKACDWRDPPWVMIEDKLPELICDYAQAVSDQANELALFDFQLSTKEAEIGGLRKALEPFAIEAVCWAQIWPDAHHPAIHPAGNSCDNCDQPPGCELSELTVGDFRRAAEALRLSREPRTYPGGHTKAEWNVIAANSMAIPTEEDD
jgi:hypothetical protein